MSITEEEYERCIVLDTQIKELTSLITENYFSYNRRVATLISDEVNAKIAEIQKEKDELIIPKEEEILGANVLKEMVCP